MPKLLSRLSSSLLLSLSFLLYSCGGGGGSEPTAPNNPANNSSSTVWSAKYGGAGGDEMEGIQTTTDGGYIVVGSTDSFSSNDTGDAWVVKLDASGNVEWAKSYGGTQDDMAIDVKQTSDGGYIIAGWTKSFGAGQSDFWVFKLTSTGAVEWEKSYGGTGNEQAWSVDVTKDGGYLVAGGTASFGAGGSDYWVLKLDVSGDIVWQKTYGGTQDDAPPGQYDEYVARALEDADGNYVVASETNSFGHGDSDIWVIKLNPTDGSILWQYAYGDIDSDSMWTFQEAVGGGYIVPGLTTLSGATDSDLWVLQLNTDGSIQWQKTFGLSGLSDEALTVGATSDGGALVGGYYESSNTDWTASLIRLDANGNALWQKKYKNRNMDWPNAVQELSDGSFIVAGVTTLVSNAVWDEDLWVLKVASDGSIGTACSLVSSLSTTTTVTSTSPLSTNATGQATSVSPQNSSAVVKDVTTSPSLICSE